MNHNERTKLQNDAINLLELIEDTSEHFCDEHLCSGEQFYIMMKAWVDCKLREFPIDFDEIYICAPSASRKQMIDIVDECKKSKKPFKT